MIEFGEVRVNAAEFGSQGSAVLGIRDSGKTYTATWLAEQLFDAGIPFIAFDPIGVWRFLRVPGSGKGYPIVVAGGQEGDLPLSPASAPMIVEAAMQNGVSLVIDLFDINLSKADWRAIVRDCVRLLLHRNKEYGLRHVFLEEAAEFAPQRVLDGLVYAEIEKLARMGGNSRLGFTLINQRAQELNKAVLELCENLFLHRQKGKNALDSLRKWLELAGASGGEVMRTLPTLRQGECWAWLGGSETPFHLEVPHKSSLHPDRRLMHGDAAAVAKKAVSVGKFVAALTKTLPKLEEEANAKDPAKLRAEIAKLQRELAAAQKGNAPTWPDLREDYARIKKVAKVNQDRGDGLRKQIEAIAKIVSAPVAPRIEVATDLEHVALLDISKHAPAAPAKLVEHVAGSVKEANGAVPPGTKPTLSVLASIYPAGMTRGQLAARVGIKKKGTTFGSYLSRLRTAAMIEERDGLIFASALGASVIGEIAPLPPPGPELARSWASKLPGTSPVVEYLLGRHPGWVERDEIADALQINPSGTTLGSYVSRLFTAGVVAKDGTKIRLTDDVMGA